MTNVYVVGGSIKMSDQIYDSITQARKDSNYQDKRLEAIIGALVIKLIDKKILSFDEATEIMTATDLFAELGRKMAKK